MKQKHTYLFSAIFTLWASSAWASSSVSDVGSAIVGEGHASSEIRMGVNEGDDETRLRSRVHYDYGFNDWYAVRFIALQDMPDGDSYEHEAVTMEHRFQLIEKRDHGFDAGFRLVYTKKDGDKTPDDVDLVLLTQVPFGNYEWRTNAVFEREVGAHQTPGIALELRNQVTYDFGAFDIGIEMFNDFSKLNEQSGYDDASHDIGPVIKGDLGESLYYQAGYRAGISDAAADHTFKFFVGAHF